MNNSTSCISEKLAKLIRCQTVTVRNGNNYSAFGEIHALLPKLYPNVFATMNLEIIGGYSMVLRWSGSDKTAKPILFCAHLDVVPAGEDWTKNPFGGEIENGKIYGSGTIDMKNILACLLESAEDLIGEGFIPKQDIYFAFGHDEEIGGFEGAGKIAQYFNENEIKFAMVVDEGGFIGEVNRQKIARIAVAEKGILNLVLTAKDGGGHASVPPEKSALGRLSEAVSRIESNKSPLVLIDVVRDYFAVIMPDCDFENLQELSKKRDYNALLRTTAVATMMQAGHAHNVLPKIATANINVRLMPGEKAVDYYGFVCDLISDLDVEIAMNVLRETDKISDYKSETFKQFCNISKEIFVDAKPVPYLMTGSTDSSFYEPLTDNIYKFCPFELEKNQFSTIHAADEYVTQKSLHGAVLFYKKLMQAKW